MKRTFLAFFLFLTVFLIPGSAAITVVQHKSGNASADNITVAFDSSVTSTGGTIAVSIRTSANKSSSIAVSDTAGNTYTKAIDTEGIYFVFYASNITSGFTNVTCTFTTSASVLMNIVEISNTRATAALDINIAPAANTGTNITTGVTATRSQAHEILYCSVRSNAAQTLTEGTGFSALETQGGEQLSDEYQIVTATGTTAGTWTGSSSGTTWRVGMLTFKAKAPAITSLDVNTGVTGTSVQITGTNFWPTQGSSTVKFNGSTATCGAWTDTQVTCTVPSGATTGNVVVHVDEDSNGVNFTVLGVAIIHRLQQQLNIY